MLPGFSFTRGASQEVSPLEQDSVFSDPVVIYGVEDARKGSVMGSVCFSDSDSVKANADDGGDPYTLMLETAGADCLIHGFLNVP